MAETLGFRFQKTQPVLREVKHRILNTRPLAPDLQNFAQDVFDTVLEPLLVLDAALRVRSANTAFYLSDRFRGNEDHVIAAYNAGEGNVRRFDGVPPFRETRGSTDFSVLCAHGWKDK